MQRFISRSRKIFLKNSKLVFTAIVLLCVNVAAVLAGNSNYSNLTFDQISSGFYLHTVPDPKGVLLILPGLDENPMGYAAITAVMADRSYETAILSQGEAIPVSPASWGLPDSHVNAQSLIRLVGSAVQSLRKKVPNIRIDVLAHSMGAIAINGWVSSVPDMALESVGSVIESNPPLSLIPFIDGETMEMISSGRYGESIPIMIDAGSLEHSLAIKSEKPSGFIMAQFQLLEWMLRSDALDRRAKIPTQIVISDYDPNLQQNGAIWFVNELKTRGHPVSAFVLNTHAHNIWRKPSADVLALLPGGERHLKDGGNWDRIITEKATLETHLTLYLGCVSAMRRTLNGTYPPPPVEPGSVAGDLFQ